MRVASQFCTAQGGPQETTTAFCIAETSDPDALLAACNTLGVAETGRVACSGLGYSAEACTVVADTVANAFADCDSLAVGAPALCPALAELTTDPDCDTWAANEEMKMCEEPTKD